MDATKLSELKVLMDQCKSDPSLLSTPALESLGANEDGKDSKARSFLVEEESDDENLGNDDHNSLENLEGSCFGSSDEEASDTYPISKDTEKMLEEFHMSGYRDGIIAGKEAAAQQGYNIGYKESVLDGYKFGIVRGVSSPLAFLPSELREKLIDEQETRDEFQKLHGYVHGLSTEVAMRLFYGTLTTKQGDEKSGEQGSDSGLGLGLGLGSRSVCVAATTDLGSYVTELSSLLDKSPKIEVNHLMHS